MSPARRYLQQRTRRRAQRCGSPLIGLLASLTRSRRARTGVVILVLLIIAALLAPVISPGDPARITGAPAAAPARHDDSAGAFLRPRPDWCIFPPTAWCDRKMNRWYS